MKTDFSRIRSCHEFTGAWVPLLLVVLSFSIASTLLAENIPNPNWVCPNGLTWEECGHIDCGQKWLCTSDLRPYSKAYSQVGEGLSRFPDKRLRDNEEAEVGDEGGDDSQLLSSGNTNTNPRAQGSVNRSTSQEASPGIESGENSCKAPSLFPDFADPDQSRATYSYDQETNDFEDEPLGSNNPEQGQGNQQSPSAESPRVSDGPEGTRASKDQELFNLVAYGGNGFLQLKEGGIEVNEDGKVELKVKEATIYSEKEGGGPYVDQEIVLTPDQCANLKEQLKVTASESKREMDNSMKEGFDDTRIRVVTTEQFREALMFSAMVQGGFAEAATSVPLLLAGPVLEVALWLETAAHITEGIKTGNSLVELALIDANRPGDNTSELVELAGGQEHVEFMLVNTTWGQQQLMEYGDWNPTRQATGPDDFFEDRKFHSVDPAEYYSEQDLARARAIAPEVAQRLIKSAIEYERYHFYAYEYERLHQLEELLTRKIEKGK